MRTRGGMRNAAASTSAPPISNRTDVAKRGPVKKMRKEQDRSPNSDVAETERPKPSTSRSRAGKLRDVMNMPIDIFTEVCFYLGPRDIRSLSLTSRRLRDVLMTKSAKVIWKRSLVHDQGLPECPPDLSEPAFVSLLFGSSCYVCGSRFGTRVDYFNRLRFCPSCHEKNMVTWYKAREKWNKSVPYDLLKALNSSTSCNWSERKGNGRGIEAMTYYKKTLKEAQNKYLSFLKKPKDQAGADLYQEEFIAECAERRRTAQKMILWEKGQALSRGLELIDIKNDRFQSIQEKLIELGWQAGDLPIRNKQFASLVRKPQTLTDKVWKNLLPKLEPYMVAGKAERLQREADRRRWNRTRRLREHYQELLNEVMTDDLKQCRCRPSDQDILDHELVKPLLDNDTEDIADEAWEGIKEDIKEFLLDHLESALIPLAELLGHPLPGQDLPRMERIATLAGRLALVTSAIWCETCKLRIFFPETINHRQDWHSHPDEVELAPLPEDQQEFLFRTLRACNLDPETTKSSELQWDSNFVCSRCDPRVAVYGWLKAMFDHAVKCKDWHTAASEETASAEMNDESRREPATAAIHDDHDWEDPSPFITHLTQGEMQDLQAAQAAFQTAAMTDPKNDKLGVGGEDFRNSFWSRREWRVCTLCPEGFAPKPVIATQLEIHLKARHHWEDEDIKEVSKVVRYGYGNGRETSQTCPA